MKKKKQQIVNPQQTQLEKLTELGSRLREIRTEQKLSLDEVATRTMIRMRLLKAIESGRLDLLPEPVYIRGLIKQFAEALGLKGEEFARDFPIYFSQPLLKPKWQSFRIGQLRPIHLYLLYVVIVLAAVNSLSMTIERSILQVNGVQPEKQSLEPENQIDTPPQKLDQVNSESKPVVVGVTVKSESWLRIVADGKTEFEGTLEEGSQRTWVADQKLTVLAGNAGGILVAFNDQKAKQLGPPNQVQEVTYQANPKS
ncbi:MAG: DUF4115 domain-containing protein [Oscillatoria sp. PMC 1068.18]|nr:DUF4115 domain-containing protein [Oscillatoria sp. PMC 1076.18]MEC4990477.1 DUF4115 domain-containing protein [Oscillatoria sp. PMC 1068.18]